ncbi:MAG: hypothetical protein KZQ86_16200 [Candidatus Thiodiazotropha sp. (ex Lucinoma kastoroae)]|nr:hypothetical protein [Candidatus Thiodiazotropha sp. (ex Lucinoma kastoroae)]
MPTIGGIFNHRGLRFLPAVEMTVTHQSKLQSSLSYRNHTQLPYTSRCLDGLEAHYFIDEGQYAE